MGGGAAPICGLVRFMVISTSRCKDRCCRQTAMARVSLLNPRHSGRGFYNRLHARARRRSSALTHSDNPEDSRRPHQRRVSAVRGTWDAWKRRKFDISEDRRSLEASPSAAYRSDSRAKCGSSNARTLVSGPSRRLTQSSYVKNGSAVSDPMIRSACSIIGSAATHFIHVVGT
jgi:hypothetical protein